MKSRQFNHFFAVASLLFLCFSFGCQPPETQEAVEKEKPQGGIFGKTVREVGEWDPNGGQKIREEGGDKVNFVNRSLQGASSAIQDVAQLKVKQSLELFRAEKGRYPKSHEEFMEDVFKRYVIELPMPVTSCEYQYDVENHQLLLVEKKEQ